MTLHESSPKLGGEVLTAQGPVGAVRVGVVVGEVGMAVSPVGEVGAAAMPFQGAGAAPMVGSPLRRQCRWEWRWPVTSRPH